MTDTVVAVTGPPKGAAPEVEPEVGLPKAAMQEPTVTAAAVLAVVCWNVVAGV